MGIAVGISLLSCIEAEIYVMPFLLPVNGRHLRFYTNSDIGQYCHLSLRVAWPRKHGYSCWSFVPMLFTNWDITTSGLKDAILVFILPVRSRNNTDSPIGLLDLKNHSFSRWNFFSIMSTSWDRSFYGFGCRHFWISHFQLSRTTFLVIPWDR